MVSDSVRVPLLHDFMAMNIALYLLYMGHGQCYSFYSGLCSLQQQQILLLHICCYLLVDFEYNGIMFCVMLLAATVH